MTRLSGPQPSMTRLSGPQPSMARLRGPDVDRRVAALAERQHGVVARAQLIQSGVTAGTIDSWVRSRRLRPLHRGVYVPGALIGALLPPYHHEMAAVLACGPTAVVSHETAGRLWDMITRPRAGRVDVSVSGHDRRRCGIGVHRVAALPADDCRERLGIPATSPARTLLDLATRLGPRDLEHALACGVRAEHVDMAELRQRLERAAPQRGLRLLRSLLALHVEPAMTRSEAEERLLRLLRRARLPSPEVNAAVAGFEVDFLWREQGLAVEVDGFEYHSSRRAFERDRERDASLAAGGILVVRVTWRQITRESEAVLARIAGTLARAHPR